MANFLNQVGLKKVFNLLRTYLGGTFIPLSQKGRNNGVATLNAEGKVPPAQAPFALRGNLVAKDINSTTLQTGFYRIIGQQLGDEILGGDAANGVLIQYSDGYREQMLMVGRSADAAAGEQVETYTRRYLPAASRWTEWSKGGGGTSDDIYVVHLRSVSGDTTFTLVEPVQEVFDARDNGKTIVGIAKVLRSEGVLNYIPNIDGVDVIPLASCVYVAKGKLIFDIYPIYRSGGQVIKNRISFDLGRMTDNEAKTGTSEGGRTISAKVLKDAILHHTSNLVNGGSYNSETKKIELKHDSTVLAEIDAKEFIKDGMVDSVNIENGNLVISFNTDSGKEDISLALIDIFNPDNYYTKQQTDGLLSEKASTAEVGELQQQLESKQDIIQDLDEIRSGAAAGATAVQTETDPTVPEWAKQERKPSYSTSELTNDGDGQSPFATEKQLEENVGALQQQVDGKQDTISDLDEIRAGAGLGKTALQVESDPTVPEWAKQPTKPSYTAQEVGALPVDTPMFSGDYNDLENKPTIPVVPTKVSAFDNDAGYLTEHQDISGLVNGGAYNSETKKIELKHGDTVLAEIDAAPFIVDGMVEDVRIENGNLVINFNTDSGKQAISIPLIDIFNPDNYYNKEQTDIKLSDKQDVIQDLPEIRAGAAAGATAVQPGDLQPYATEQWVGQQGFLTEHQDISGKVDKVQGKQLSTEDYTTEEKQKLAGLSNYDDTELAERVTANETAIAGKQDKISDLDSIREGASKGATALQEHQPMKTLNNESLVGEGNINLKGNVQANWDQTDPTADDYINNKPEIKSVEPFIVTVDSNNVADKTVAEIVTAYNEGKICIMIGPNSRIYYLGQIEDNDIIRFTSTTGIDYLYLAEMFGSQPSIVDFRSTLLARISSPNFSGTPTAPTAPVGTNTKQIATTAFVKGATENMYTKEEVDNLIPDVSGKADLSEVYTKTDVDNLIANVMASIPSLFITRYQNGVLNRTHQEIEDAYYSALNQILFFNGKIYTIKGGPAGGDALFISTDPTDKAIIRVTPQNAVTVESY